MPGCIMPFDIDPFDIAFDIVAKKIVPHLKDFQRQLTSMNFPIGWRIRVQVFVGLI